MKKQRLAELEEFIHIVSKSRYLPEFELRIVCLKTHILSALHGSNSKGGQHCVYLILSPRQPMGVCSVLPA